MNKIDIVKERQLYNIEGLIDKDFEFYELRDLCCHVCGKRLGFMANFISDQIHPEFMCDDCKKEVLS